MILWGGKDILYIMEKKDSFLNLITLPSLKDIIPTTEVRVSRITAELMKKKRGSKAVDSTHWEVRSNAAGRTLLRYEPKEDAYYLTPFIRNDGKSPVEEFVNKVRDHYTVEKRLRLFKYYSRIHDDAKELLVNDPEFEKLFMETNSFPAVILSADIRDSSAMVAMENESGEFAQFIQEVILSLGDCVKNNFGIYDKFTGDGILAFFPPFYSGKDAVLHALACAKECHELYDSIYAKHASAFNSTAHGLGIGLASGTVWQSGTDSEFTTVGYPVVEACRLSGADAGHTYVSLDVWKEVIALGKEKDFTFVTERKSYTAKGRDFPMVDITFAKEIPEYTPPDWFMGISPKLA